MKKYCKTFSYARIILVVLFLVVSSQLYAEQTQWPDPDQYGHEGWIKTNWDQGGHFEDPRWVETHFDDKCPLLQPEGTVTRCAVGCVATAMAQIINYWKYPGSVQFSASPWWLGGDSYTSYNEDAGTINIDGDAVVRDFPSFKNDRPAKPSLNTVLSTIDYSGDPNEEAYLCFGAGIGARTWYGSTSGAHLPILAYKTHFHYGSAAYGLDPTGTVLWNSLWRPTVIESIKKGWPVQIGIASSRGAGPHSVIIDGYKSTGEFHINFGWGGRGDGWYNNLPIIDTSQAPYPGSSYYDAITEIVLNISPYQGWSQWGADEKNSFRTPYAAPTTNPPVDKWQVTSRGVYKMTGLVVGTGNKIYAAYSPRFGSDPDLDKPYILVVDQYGVKKDEIKITDESGDILYPVQNKKGEVFVAGQSGHIYKIGTRTENPTPILYFNEPYGDTLYGLKVDSEGIVYAVTSKRVYQIISPALWREYPVEGQFYLGHETPAVDVKRNKVYFSYYNSSMQTAYLGCLDRQTGLPAYLPKPFPNVLNAHQGTGVPSIGPDGTVYVGCGTTLYAFAPGPLGLIQLWQKTPGISYISDSPTIAEDGTIYLTYWKNDTECVVGARDPTNGNIKWEIPFYSAGDDEYVNVKDLYTASNKVVVFFVRRQELIDDDVVENYTVYAYRDNGDSYERLWEKDYGTIGGLLAFGPGATIYVMPQTGDENTLYAISEGPMADPHGGGMGYTDNAAPSIPSNPTPTDGAQSVDYDITLSWDCTDPDPNHNLKYSVFVGESGYDMVPVATDFTDTSYALSGLTAGTGYAWKIIATDGQAVTEGPTWVFATKTQPLVCDFCGEGSEQPDGYVDYWDLLHFAQRWHTRLGDPGWDSRCDLDKEDNYVDYWDLLVFAQQWHKGQKP